MKDRITTIRPDILVECSDGLEVFDGSLTHKDIRPKGAFMFVDFTVDRSDLWNEDTEFVDDDGNDTPEGVLLDDGELLAYELPAFENSEKFTIDIEYIPTYSGIPSETIGIYSLSADIGDTYTPVRKDCITLKHEALTGNLVFNVLDNTGIPYITYSVDFPVDAGEAYRIVVTVDNTVNVNDVASSIYVNGKYIPPMSPSTGIKDNSNRIMDISNIMFGGFENKSYTADFTLGSFALFSEVIYTESYIVFDYPSTIYSTDMQVAILEVEKVSARRIIEFLNYDMSRNIGFVLLVDDLDEDNRGEYTPRFYDTVVNKWVTPVDEFDDTNDILEWNEKNLYHLWHKPVKVRLKVFMLSDGYGREYFTSIGMRYEWYLIKTPEIHYTLVYGLISSTHQLKSDYRVSAVLNGKTVYAGKITMYPEKKEAVTDSRMYWEILLPDTDNMYSGSFYEFTLNIGGDVRVENLTVPKTDVIEFEELVSNQESQIGDIV